MPNIVDFLPLMKVSGRCGYFKDKACTQLYTLAPWIEKQTENLLPMTRIYADFKEAGYCRFNNQFYLHKCHNCNQCHAIRIPVTSFEASKSQRHVWNKNQDMEVTLVKNPLEALTDEKVFIFREYDYFHNKAAGEPKKTMDEAREMLTQMNSGYPGVWNMEYRLDGKLIGVAILDITTKADGKITGLCSNYFYYDTSDSVRKRSLGVFSVLQEIALCMELEIPYYYLGLYLPDCKKMNYKANYKPYELFVDGKWVPGDAGGVVGNAPWLEGVAEDANGAGARGRVTSLTSLVFDSEASENKTSHSPHNTYTYIDLPPAGSYMPEYEDICFITGDIDQDFLYSAYLQGIFPWFNEDEGEPVVWQCPAQRFVIFPENFHVSKSIDKFLKHTPYTYTKDRAFEQVIENCAAQVRSGQNGTWIGPMIKEAYKKLHKAGIAHSYEAWLGDRLAGGFYGVDLGGVFCGESMFTIEPDSSKSAFVLFAREFFAAGGKMIDCQCETENMKRYGGVNIPREEYLQRLKAYCKAAFGG